MLTLDDISIKVSGRELLRHIGITLFPGALLNIFGSNGVGKSTLLATIAGLSEVTKNRILLEGMCVAESISRYHEKLAYLGHNLGLKDKLTVHENLVFWGQHFDTEMIIPAVVSNLALNEYIEISVENLSMGNKKRLAIAIIMLSNKKIWLLDEPYSNLDETGCVILDNAISAHTSSQGIVIMTSHSALNVPNIINLDLQQYV